MAAPILCAVDFGALADATVRFASVVARLTDAPITLLHMKERGEGTETSDARLAALALPFTAEGLIVEVKMAHGDPAEAIVRRAAELRASAIVMGTHGGRGMERLMLGSAAESVLHRAGRPVVTVRSPRHTDGPIRKIVCGADLADPAPLRHAAGLARRAAAALVVVHAVQDLPEEGGRGLVPASYGPVLLEEARKKLGLALAFLDSFPPGLLESRVVPGGAARALLRIADEESADLLVVGVHPHVLGSTTHPIVRGANCPVLTVPGGAGGEVIA